MVQVLRSSPCKVGSTAKEISRVGDSLTVKGKRDRSSFIVPGQRDNGTGRDSQNLGQDGPGQPKYGMGHGTKQDRVEKDVLKHRKVFQKKKRTF